MSPNGSSLPKVVIPIDCLFVGRDVTTRHALWCAKRGLLASNYCRLNDEALSDGILNKVDPVEQVHSQGKEEEHRQQQ
jgi:hypothetical protein